MMLSAAVGLSAVRQPERGRARQVEPDELGQRGRPPAQRLAD